MQRVLIENFDGCSGYGDGYGDGGGYGLMREILIFVHDGYGVGYGCGDGTGYGSGDNMVEIAPKMQGRR